MPKSEKQRLHLERLSKAKIGKISPKKGKSCGPFTKEHRLALCKAQKKYFKTHSTWNKGKDCSKYGFGRKKD